MVTDKQKQNKQTNKRKKQKEKKKKVIGGAKFLSKYMSGLDPSKEDVNRRSYSESKIASSMTESFPSKTSSNMTESFSRANCVKYD